MSHTLKGPARAARAGEAMIVDLTYIDQPRETMDLGQPRWSHWRPEALALLTAVNAAPPHAIVLVELCPHCFWPLDSISHASVDGVCWHCGRQA
jgi:hypothetical protein